MRSTRREPSDHIGDFPIRHWLSRDVPAPVRRTQFRSARDDDCAQSLVADECQEGIVGYGAAPGPAPAFSAVAGCTICSINNLAICAITRSFCRVGRRIAAVQNPLSRPTGKYSARNHINLLIRQHASRALSESRHRGSVYAIGNHALHGALIDNGQINRIGQRDRCSSSSVRAVTARAVFRVKSGKLQNLIRRDRLGSFRGLTER